MTSKLIPTLLKAQTLPESSLATRMTLRDCTLFVQVPRELLSEENHVGMNGIIPRRPIRIIIADLDEKSEEIRGEYWKSLEQSLIAGEYYLGAGKLDSAEDCDLSDDVAWLTSTPGLKNGIGDS
jgi:Inositol-pentakisphosphate 2-kinase